MAEETGFEDGRIPNFEGLVTLTLTLTLTGSYVTPLHTLLAASLCFKCQSVLQLTKLEQRS